MKQLKVKIHTHPIYIFWMLKIIFDKFYQADGSHKAEGNGLGLALVKRIIDSAGGTIEAQNREYGGCRFVVQLPLQ